MKIMDRCFLCESSEDDPIKLGKLLKKQGLAVHYYCLLFSSNLTQNGDDDDGFMGFLKYDIKLEKKRIKSLICYYCKKPSANVSCCATKCIRTFHLSCGLDNQAVCHFFDTFRTICGRHQSCRKVKRKHTHDEICSICYEKMGQFKVVESLLSPCCRSGWFHKRCLAEFAIHSGYFFKCPLCNNKDDFRKTLLRRGIFVPDKDAEWELEPNAYADLLERPSKCVAEICSCPDGREFKSKKIRFLICNTCGSKSIHKMCVDKGQKTFTCSDCEEILNSFNNDNLQTNAEPDIDVVAISNENSTQQPLTQSDSLPVTIQSDNNELADNSKNLLNVELPVKRKFKEMTEKDLVEDKSDDSEEKVIKKTKLMRTQSIDASPIIKHSTEINSNCYPNRIRTRRQSRSLSYDHIFTYIGKPSKEIIESLGNTLKNSQLKKKRKKDLDVDVDQDLLPVSRRQTLISSRRQSKHIENDFTPSELTNSKPRANSSASSSSTDSSASNDGMDRNGNDRKQNSSSEVATSSKALTFHNCDDDNNGKNKIPEYSEIPKIPTNTLESVETNNNSNDQETWLWNNDDSGFTLSSNSGNSIKELGLEKNCLTKSHRRARAFTDLDTPCTPINSKSNGKLRRKADKFCTQGQAYIILD